MRYFFRHPCIVGFSKSWPFQAKNQFRSHNRYFATTAKSVILMVRQACFAQTLQFYEQGLGLKIRHKSEEWAEFHAHDFPIILKAVQNESECSTGYSPMICLEVDDMDMVIQSCWTAFITFDGAGLERDNYWVTLSVKKATSWRNVRSKRGISIASVLPLGASLDGAIQYPVHGKIASIRTPDGHMVGLFEAAL